MNLRPSWYLGKTHFALVSAAFMKAGLTGISVYAAPYRRFRFVTVQYPQRRGELCSKVRAALCPYQWTLVLFRMMHLAKSLPSSRQTPDPRRRPASSFSFLRTRLL